MFRVQLFLLPPKEFDILVTITTILKNIYFIKISRLKKWTLGVIEEEVQTLVEVSEVLSELS